MSNRNICRAVQIQLVQVNAHMAAVSIHTLGKSTIVRVRRVRQTDRQHVVSTDLIHGLFANAPAHHQRSAIIIPIMTGMAVQVMRKIIIFIITVDIITVQHITVTKLVIILANITKMIITTTGHLSRVTMKKTINLILVIKEMLI